MQTTGGIQFPVSLTSIYLRVAKVQLCENSSRPGLGLMPCYIKIQLARAPAPLPSVPGMSAGPVPLAFSGYRSNCLAFMFLSTP